MRLGPCIQHRLDLYILLLTETDCEMGEISPIIIRMLKMVTKAISEILTFQIRKFLRSFADSIVGRLLLISNHVILPEVE